MSTYVNCPKCDSEFDFDIVLVNVGGWAPLIRDEKQMCDCTFTESELETIREQAMNQFCEV